MVARFLWGAVPRPGTTPRLVRTMTLSGVPSHCCYAVRGIKEQVWVGSPDGCSVHDQVDGRLLRFVPWDLVRIQANADCWKREACTDIAVDQHGRQTFALTPNGRIHVVAFNGGDITPTRTLKARLCADHLVSNGQGLLFLAQWKEGRVLIADAEREERIGELRRPPGDPSFEHAWQLACNAKGTEVFVLLAGGMVQVFDTQGTFLRSFHCDYDHVHSPSNLCHPTSISIGLDDYVYIGNGHGMFVFRETGEFVCMFGTPYAFRANVHQLEDGSFWVSTTDSKMQLYVFDLCL